jgi:HD superfamily phosphohydrolase
VLKKQWNISPSDVVALLNRSKAPKEHLFEMNAWSLLSSILSGPIDIDKMDYLYRDSLHAGVPYGRHFDQNRLIRSLTVNEAADGLALTDKGKTAAELMVFARYVMFNEVYWHKSVRSATAMLQRAFYELRERFDLKTCFDVTESEMITKLRETAVGTDAEILTEGIFGSQRTLFKRVVEYSTVQQPEIYHLLAGKHYTWLCEVSKRLWKLVKKQIAVRDIPSTSLLLDAPPIEREVEFRIDVYYPKENKYRLLSDVSPVVKTLAHEQFDDHVKKARIFATEPIAEKLRTLKNLPELVIQAVNEIG